MVRVCDHVGSAFYNSTDGKTRICYRCGNNVMGLLAEGGTTYAQRNHPATSHDAAVSAQPQAKTDEALCLRLITDTGTRGAIADEISAQVEAEGRIFPPNQVASRLMGLREKGLVVRGVPADTRKTRRNVKARVHYVKGDEPI